MRLDSDALLVLAFEWIAEEADCEILSRCEHAVSVGRVWLVHRTEMGFHTLGLGTEYGKSIGFGEVLGSGGLTFSYTSNLGTLRRNPYLSRIDIPKSTSRHLGCGRRCR